MVVFGFVTILGIFIWAFKAFALRDRNSIDERMDRGFSSLGRSLDLLRETVGQRLDGQDRRLDFHDHEVSAVVKTVARLEGEHAAAMRGLHVHTRSEDPPLHP
jgi:uncharacterized membrane-anchored protein